MEIRVVSGTKEKMLKLGHQVIAVTEYAGDRLPALMRQLFSIWREPK